MCESKPLYEHDCNECVFLGVFNTQDLYSCKTNESPASATVIARRSSEESDYSSGIGFKHNANLLEATRRALEVGSLSQADVDFWEGIL